MVTFSHLTKKIHELYTQLMSTSHGIRVCDPNRCTKAEVTWRAKVQSKTPQTDRREIENVIGFQKKVKLSARTFTENRCQAEHLTWASKDRWDFDVYKQW